MSMINRNDELFKCDSPIILDDLKNGWILMDPEYINDEQYVREHPRFIRQRSNLWFDVRQEARLTGSSMHDALGFRTLKNQRQHYDKFVEKRPHEIPDTMQNALEHGQKHEVIHTCI